MPAVWRDGRPSLGLVLALVLATVLALPLAGVLASGVYDDQLLRRTEAELLAQSAALAADAARAVRETVPADVPLGREIPAGPPADLAAPLATLLPPRPDAVPPAGPPDPAFRALGERLAPDLAATQAVTLAGLRLLDPAGTVIAGRGEVGLSLAGVDEVAAALSGRSAAALRRRVSHHAYPRLGSVSRGRPARIFVAVPVAVRGRVAGVVYASRTPADLLGSLYDQRAALGLAAAAVVAAAALAGLALHRAIGLPVRELIGLTEAIGARDAAAVASHRHHGTVEFAALAASLRGMAARLTERGDAIAGFAAHVSHELKSPLSAIRGSAELLADDDPVDPMWPEERRRFLGHLLADAERLGTLLERLRGMAQAEAEPTAGRTTLGAALDALRARFPALVFTAEGEADAVLRISADNLLVLLGHLADNAARHGAGALAMSARRDGPAVRVEVRDDGAGISPGNRGRVFDAFFTTRRESGGTGMGLAIVRALVGAHGGTVSLIDTARGAGFAIGIPAEPVVPSVPLPRRRRALAFTGGVVLAGLALRLWGPGLGVPFALTKYGGSVLWGAMVYGIIAVVRPSARSVRLAAAALLVAMLVELFRLVHAPGLDAFRLTTAGALLLGRVFSPWNVVAYACGIAGAWMSCATGPLGAPYGTEGSATGCPPAVRAPASVRRAARRSASAEEPEAMKPDRPHDIAITPHHGRVRIVFAGRTVADTTRALDLAEGALRPVLYVPRADADLAAFEPTARRTHCPFKGEASYFTLRSGGREAQNAVWSYEAPLPGAAAIAGHLAFYPDQVEVLHG